MSASGVFAFSLAYAAALPNPGVSVDSGEYLAVSEGLAEGRGFTMPYVNFDEPWRVLDGERVPMAQFPPLYPTVLASVQRGLGLSSLDTARLIGSVAFLLSIVVGQLLVWRQTKRLSATLLAGVLLMAPDLLTIHAMAWSEPLMTLALLGVLHGLCRYSESKRQIYLVAAGVFGAVASLARFAGVALIVGAAIVLFLIENGSRGPRLRRGLVFSFLSMAPVIAWLVRNTVTVGVASEKSFGWHPPRGDDLRQAIETIGGWLVPAGITALIAGIVIVILVARGARGHLRPLLRGEAGPIPTICTIIGICYLGFVMASRTFLDQNIPLDPRIFAPLQVLVIVGLCAWLGAVVKPKPSVVAPLIALVALVSFGRSAFIAHGFTSLNVTSYTNDHWRKSPTLRFAGTVAPETLIITNAPDPIWLWHDRNAQLLPTRVNLYSGNPNPRYLSQLDELHEATRCRNAVVLFFNKPTRKPRRLLEHQVVSALGLRKEQRLRDGEIHSVTEPGCDS
jgi:Dolichyl-phosphate-mannose-protein mannosyltransferase